MQAYWEGPGSVIRLGLHKSSREHTLSEKNISLSHNADLNRYTIEVDGELAGFADYVESSQGVRDFNHTVVDPAFRGQGLSSPLIKYALDDTAEQDTKIAASCSAVEHFLDKNPEYRDMVA